MLFCWDDNEGGNVDHIAEQGLTPDEVESAFDVMQQKLLTSVATPTSKEHQVCFSGAAVVGTFPVPFTEFLGESRSRRRHTECACDFEDQGAVHFQLPRVGIS